MGSFDFCSYGDLTVLQAQQAFHGLPSTDASSLFLDDAFESATAAGKTILECTPLQEQKVRNHTCVCESTLPNLYFVRVADPLLSIPVSPEVTQGPYYHIAGHPSTLVSFSEFFWGADTYLSS